MPDLRSQVGNELAILAEQRGLPALGLVVYVEVRASFVLHAAAGAAHVHSLACTGSVPADSSP